ncbi:MAG: hypothetical protein AAGA56_22820 [Myxococcota bacterium]
MTEKVAPSPPRGRVFDVGCTIRISHTAEDLSAHVELDGELNVEAGDRVQVHGDPITVNFGEVRLLRRTATVTRAHPLKKWWTRVTGDLGFFELIELGFSEKRLL